MNVAPKSRGDGNAGAQPDARGANPAGGGEANEENVARRSWMRLLLWLAVGVTGQVAVLSTVDAGKAVHFQHARPLAHPAAMVFVALEAAAVAAGVWRSGFRWPWGGAWLLALLAGAAGTAATVSRAPAEWILETAFSLTAQAAALGAFGLAAQASPESVVRGLRRAIGGEGVRIPALAAVAAFAAAAALSVGVYERQPHVQDEVAYLHQARSFAAGRAAMPAPPVPEAFEYFLLDVQKGGAAAVTPPGFALLLAPAAWLNLEWLVNPLLGGLNVWLLFLVLRRLYAPPVPVLGALLLVVSPWHCFLAMSFMNHTAGLTAVLLASLGVLRGGAAWAAAAGLLLGGMSLSRPLDAAAFTGLCVVWMAVRRKPWPALVLAAAAAGALALPYNQAVTGNAFSFPLSRYMDRIYGLGRNSLGFGPNRGLPWPIDPFPGHGPADVVINAQINASGLNTELFGWAAGSLVFLLAFTAARKWNEADRWMAAVAVATAAVYSLYWFSGGPDFGPRYWFLMLAPCVALTARGIVLAGERFGERTLMLAALLTLSAWATFVPWRAVDKYSGYLGMTPALRQLAEREQFGRSLVVIRGPEFPDYAAVAWMNPWDWKGEGPVYARDAGPGTVRQLKEAYPDRPFWVVAGPSLTGGGYRIVERPRP